jgi:Protein of unknown function (DUF3618)
MGERPDQIERQIAETRGELSENIGELQNKVKSAVNWRTQFQEHPGTLLAVAFGGGVVLAALLPSSGRSREKDSASYNSSSSNKPNDLGRTIEAMTGALLGVAVKQASGFLDSLLPGFHEEFTRAKGKDSRHDDPIDAVYATTEESAPMPLTAKARA